jgi:hypothetical protein
VAHEKRLFKSFIGIFKGFIESGHEFIAEIITPYHPEFVPLLGSFMLVRVSEAEALLGRITQFYPVGTMAGAEAEEYLAQLQKLERPVPEDVKELKLRYNVKMRLLGTVELHQGRFRYRPGIRTLPHLGAAVGELTEEALDFVCNARLQEEEDTVPIGYYSLGDRVTKHQVKFGFSRLQSKGTVVFARRGYGKSNLIKLLVAKLYEQEPKVGMLIFDPEGEYAFPDAQGRPGLANFPGIAEKLVVFTARRPPHDKYKSLIAGPVTLNLRGIAPSHVVDICFPEDRRETGYATRLKGFRADEWTKLINLLAEKGYRLEEKVIKDDFKISSHPDAVIRNVTPVVQAMNNAESHLPQSVLYYLAKGWIVIVDISLLPSGIGQQVAGLILNTVFDHNVKHFTAANPEAVIPVIAVIEEAQNVLSPEKMKQEDSPFVRWVKEGRKYRLGYTIVTQQPGAISDQLLSQADNFFVMHLVSGADLDALQRSNAHFSDDILSYVLNEPIEGNAYFWCAPSQPYVVSARLFEFKDQVEQKIKEKGELDAKALGAAVRDYQSLVTELDQLVQNVITSDKQVPIYTPVRNGETDDKYGAVNLANLGLRVGELFFEKHQDIKPWMLPQFFSEWRGKPILQHSYTAAVGDRARGRRDGQEADYLLIPLDQIQFQGKTLDSRQVELVERHPKPNGETASS